MRHLSKNVVLSVLSMVALRRRVVARGPAFVGASFRVRCSISLSVVRVVWVWISVWLGWEMKSPPIHMALLWVVFRQMAFIGWMVLLLAGFVMLAMSMVTLELDVPVVFSVTRVVIGVDIIPHCVTMLGLMLMSPVPVCL